MDEFEKSGANGARQNLQVWCCGNCEAVHFKAGNVLLNFSRAEFAELTHAVMDIYRREFGSLEFYDLIGLLKQRGDVLISRTVA